MRRFLLAAIFPWACDQHVQHVASPPAILATETKPAPTPRSPAYFAELLQKVDRGEAVDATELARVGGQWDAASSRIYWYTDLEEAKAEAKRTNKAILSLRLLGRLDEEMSCANRRLFRAVLYSNKDLSQFLRDNYVMHWSSERPVPKITLDFGDGRKVERTITGNSAHYVLDADGRAIDVLPGMYGPAAFEKGLKESLDLAKSDATEDAINKWHQKEVWRLTANWRKLLGQAYEGYDEVKNAKLPSLPSFSRYSDPLYSSLSAMEVNQLTESKADMEAPSLALLQPEVHAYADWGDWSKITVKVKSERVDEASRSFLKAKHPRDWTDADAKELDGDHFAKRITALEARLTEEELRNEYVFHGAIHRFMSKPGKLDFTTINGFVYTELFHTPRSDAWLGLHPTEAITGLENDGIRRP